MSQDRAILVIGPSRVSDLGRGAAVGSTSRHDTPPLTPRSAWLTRRLARSPCHARICPLGQHACREGLPASEVVAAILRLEATPA